MFETWILLTVAAAGIQNVRSVLQKRMTARLSVLGSTFARFLYGFPLTLVFVAAVQSVTGADLPAVHGAFFGYAVLGGACQVAGNILFIRLITFANFTISATYAKTETVLAALVSWVVLGDLLSRLGLAGVLATFAGCVVIAAARQRLSLGWLVYAARDRAAQMGLAVGALYAVASTCYRAGALSLGGDSLELAGVTTLAWVSAFQVAGLGAWLAWRQWSVVREVLIAWRQAAWIGVAGTSASACWYTAFALQKTAYVLAVGQIEIVFAYLASRYLFGERATAVELAGIAVTVAGIVLVVLAR